MTETGRRAVGQWPYARRRDYEKKLQQVAANWLKSKNFNANEKYSYILADPGGWRDNVILPEVGDYLVAEQRRRATHGEAFAFHKYIHHGLSSQAMLCNLVGPLIVRKDLEPLRVACEAAGIPWPAAATATFEVTDRSVFNEESAQPTSIDLVIGGRGKSASLFIEAKLTETEFGSCSVFQGGDCEGMSPLSDFNLCFLHFIKRKYWTKMAEHNLLAGPLARSPLCPMATYYQFFRELLFALDKGGYYVLLYDERNPAFVRATSRVAATNGIATGAGAAAGSERGLWPFLTSMLPKEHQKRTRRVSIQAVLAFIRQSGRHEDWAPEFATKYGL
jgi:POLQ-like helicase